MLRTIFRRQHFGPVYIVLRAMDAYIVTIILMVRFVGSANISPTLTHFTKYTDYAPINGDLFRNLSGTYKSLIHCTIVCSQKPGCTGIKYHNTQVMDGAVCYFLNAGVSYLEFTPGTNYLQMTSGSSIAAFPVKVKDDNVTCVASSTANYTTSCSNLWDDQKRLSLRTQWISENEGNGSWVMLQWNNSVDIIAVEMWHRCWRAEQCSKILVTFSDDKERVIKRTCGSGTHPLDCRVIVREIYTINHYQSNFVNISCLVDCEDSGTNDSWGLQEVKIYRPA